MDNDQEIPAPMLDILLIDDHEPTRREVCGLIEGEPDLSVVGQSTNAKEGLDKAEQLEPAVIIMDLAMPGMNGLAATRYLMERHPRSRVVVLSNHVGHDLVQLALAAGAKGYVRKDHAYEELVPAVRAVGEDRHFLGAGLEEE